MFGISIWLLFLLPPLGFIGIVGGLFFMLIAPFARGLLQCQDCKYAWRYPAKTGSQTRA